MPGQYRRNYRRGKPRRRYVKKISPTKKLVTGQTQPTMLEKIASGIGSAAKVASAVLPIVRAINTEVKYFDNSYTRTVDSATPTIDIQSLMATGTTETTRIGNSILGKDFNVRINMAGNFTSASSNYVRVIIFVDKETGAVTGAPSMATLLQSSTNILSAFHKDYTDRYAILKDKRIVLNTSSNPGAMFKVYKKIDFHTRFVGTGAVNPTNLGQNQIYIAIMTSNTVGQGVVCGIYSRYNFTDN